MRECILTFSFIKGQKWSKGWCTYEFDIWIWAFRKKTYELGDKVFAIFEKQTYEFGHTNSYLCQFWRNLDIRIHNLGQFWWTFWPIRAILPQIFFARACRRSRFITEPFCSGRGAKTPTRQPMHLSLCLLTPQSIVFATTGVSQIQYIKITRYWDLLECICQENHMHQWKKDQPGKWWLVRFNTHSIDTFEEWHK